MSEELKPCPFCNDGTDDLSIRGDSDECYVQCDPCGTRGPYRARGIGDSQYDKAVAAWNTLSCRLPWTREKPTVEGMYWYKESDNISMAVEVFRERVFFTNGTSADGELLYHMPGYDFDLSVDESKGLWAGPIPEPEEE